MTSIGTTGDNAPTLTPTAPATETEQAPVKQTETSGHKPLQASLVISAVRCTVVYVVLPFIFPIVGATRVMSTSISFLACAIAIISAAISIRRFWRSQHRLRWVYTIAAIVVIAFSVGSLILDLWLTASGR